MNIGSLAARLKSLLGSRTPPVAISFLDAAPAGVARVAAPQPAGCGYWSLAAGGAVFYTESEDHHGCPIGAWTHGVDLPPDVGAGLQDLVRTMVGLQYLSPEEIPTIPRRDAPFRVAVYAPLDRTPCAPDVVLARADARRMMLLAEAAQAAGIANRPAMGRPTCAIVPEVMASQMSGLSFGCIGNRVYTGTGDDESWFAVPGPRLQTLVDKLEVTVRANRELEGFHRDRLAGGGPTRTPPSR
jgi:uncharacterized protein (DUF169 family)